MEDPSLPPLRNLKEFLDQPTDLERVMDLAQQIRHGTPGLPPHRIRRTYGLASKAVTAFHICLEREVEDHELDPGCRCAPEQVWLDHVRAPVLVHHCMAGVH